MKRLALIALVAYLLTGCHHINIKGDIKFDYDHPELYRIGDAVIEQPINEIDVSWVEGQIDIVYADHPGVRIYEELDSTLDDSLRMHWYVDDEGCLDIRFCKSGCYSVERLKNINYNKHLTIEVPRCTVLDEIDMSLVSASVNIDSVVCRELTIDGVAFDVMADLPKALPDGISISGVDCSLSMCVPHEAGMTIEMSGVKKYLNSQFPTRKEGKKTIIGDGACNIDIEGVNCTLNINK